MEKNEFMMRRKILVPVMSIIAGLLTVSAVFGYYSKKGDFQFHHHQNSENVKELLDTELMQDAALLSGMLDMITQDKTFQAKWATQDREVLLSHALPIFEEIRNKYRITHFYFHGLDKVCFLRVHNPTRYGDVITRRTLSETILRDEPFSGIELGKYGTFTLRVIHPWRIDGQLVGYVELGEEIGHITQQMKAVTHHDFLVVVNKSLLDIDKWLWGMKVLPRKAGHWEQFEDVVVTDGTLDKIPDSLVQKIKEQRSLYGNRKTFFQVSFPNQQCFIVGNNPLYDVFGNQVGQIYIMENVMWKIASMRRYLLLLMMISIPSAILLFVFLYRYVGRISAMLSESYAELEREIEQRKKIEQELSEAKGRAEQASQKVIS